ncbi:Irx-a [Aphelenchoides avenae]|nr:Irx-a [Aphelenchus avenae]
MDVATDAIIRHLAGNEAKANAFMEKYYDCFRDLARDNPTAVLHMWLREHIDNPIPTKAEKMLLAIVTKMTLTEVDACT